MSYHPFISSALTNFICLTFTARLLYFLLHSTCDLLFLKSLLSLFSVILNIKQPILVLWTCNVQLFQLFQVREQESLFQLFALGTSLKSHPPSTPCPFHTSRGFRFVFRLHLIFHAFSVVILHSRHLFANFFPGLIHLDSGVIFR